MYVPAMGGMGAMNCPGDPGCPGYIAPAPSTSGSALDQVQAEIDALYQYTGAGQPSTSAPTATPAPSSGISSYTVLWIGGAFFGIVLLGKALR
jgi:hypothetical protein